MACAFIGRAKAGVVRSNWALCECLPDARSTGGRALARFEPAICRKLVRTGSLLMAITLTKPPGGQEEQALAPGSSTKEPAGHARHSTVAVASAKEPGEQGMQLALLGISSPFWKVPTWCVWGDQAPPQKWVWEAWDVG